MTDHYDITMERRMISRAGEKQFPIIKSGPIFFMKISREELT